jgi:xanthine dehydrogenase large subunit
MNKPTETGLLLKAGQPQAGAPMPHESAHLHVAGEAVYVDDIPELDGTLHAALGLSGKAHAIVTSIDLAPVRAMPGVVAVLTPKDIQGENNCGPIAHDDPIFADGLVQYVGQPMFAVIARSYDDARRAARKARVEYQDLPAVLTPQEAKRQKSFVVPPMHLKRGQPAQAIANAPR